jgi:hypothetical protein
VVTTACAHCGEAIRIRTDGHSQAEAERGAPLVFSPLVDFRRWKDPSIIDGY